MVFRAAEAAALAIGASRDEATMLATAALRPSLAGSPLWYALLPSPAPSASAPLAELLEYCATAVAAPRDVAGLGALVGLIHEIYAAHGWAVAAAHAAVGARALPDRLAATVTERARERFIVETANVVAACPPDLAALVAIAAVPPAGDLVRGTLAKLIETFALMAPRGEHARGDDRRSRGAVRDRAPPAPVIAEPLADLDDVLVSLHELGRHEWSWESVEDWTTGDPLMFAKAVTRGRGFAELTGVLERVRGELAERVTDLVADTWRDAVDRARDAAVIAAPAPLADAILDLADAAAARAAERLGAIVRTQWQGGHAESITAVCAELLGDPRDISTLWEAHVPAIRIALEHG